MHSTRDKTLLNFVWLLFAACLFTGSPVADARTKVLRDPYEYRVPANSDAQVENAIRGALAVRGWNITQDATGGLQAKLDVRNHSVTTNIKWTKDRVTFSYVTSENMDYEVIDDKIYIDRYYYRWLKILRKDIISSLKRERALAMRQIEPDIEEDLDAMDSGDGIPVKEVKIGR